MQRLYDLTKARGAHFGAVINGRCDIIDAGDDSITIGFAHPAIMQKAMQPQNLQVLSEAASEAMGRPMRVECTHDPEVGSWSKRFQRSPLVRAAEEMGARVLSKSEEQR